MGHAANCVVHTFRYSVLGWQIWYSFFVCDTTCFAMCFHLALDELGHIVNMEDSNSLLAEVFSHCLVLDKELQGFIA